MRIRRVVPNPISGESVFHTRVGGRAYRIRLGFHREGGGPLYVRVAEQTTGRLVFEREVSNSGEARLVEKTLWWAEDEIRRRGHIRQSVERNDPV